MNSPSALADGYESVEIDDFSLQISVVPNDEKAVVELWVADLSQDCWSGDLESLVDRMRPRRLTAPSPRVLEQLAPPPKPGLRRLARLGCYPIGQEPARSAHGAGGSNPVRRGGYLIRERHPRLSHGASKAVGLHVDSGPNLGDGPGSGIDVSIE